MRNSSIRPKERPYLVLTLRTRLNLTVVAMKRYSAFPKAPAFLEPYHQIVQYLNQLVYSAAAAAADWTIGHSLVWGGESYPSAEMQSVYSAAPAD